MNERQLDYFIRIAELGSFRKASETLRVAQPALTRQVRSLEERLGVALFARSARGVVLTRAGELLLERGRFIKRQTEQAISDVMAEGTTPSGAVAFGAPGSIAQLLFCPLARKYLRLYPKVTVTFSEGVSRLHSQLLSGDLDLAILPNTRGTYTRNVEVELLADEPVYLVGRAGEFPAGATCTWREVAGLPLILSPDASSVRKWVEDSRPEGSNAPLGHVETESLDLQKQLVREGVGYAVLPHAAVHTENDIGRLSLARVENSRLRRLLAWRTDKPLTPAVQKMIELARIEAAGLRAAGAFGPPLDATDAHSPPGET